MRNLQCTLFTALLALSGKAVCLQAEAKIDWDSGCAPVASPPTQPVGGQDWVHLREEVLRLGNLRGVPKTYEAEGFQEEDGIKAVYFDGLPWQGKPTRVFARLGIPAGKTGTVPGVVLVHGGGGTAFKDWVRKWNDKGFAAISIAVEGQTDRRESERSWQRHGWGGPARPGIYGDSGQPLEDQWMYHAVGDAILANSLLQHQPQVAPDKVGIMGISWGGVITSTVIGIDNRFAFAIPTYGCGGLANAPNQYGRALGDNLLYQNVWDPLVRLKEAKMPVLWFSWTGDQHFPLDAQARCYNAAPGQHLVALIPNMRHGHAPGWNPPDSYAFAESVVQNGSPWCQQLGVNVGGQDVRIHFKSAKPIDSATLVSTTGTGHTGSRDWVESLAEIRTSQVGVDVNAILPPGTTAWFVRLQSGSLVACSDFQENK